MMKHRVNTLEKMKKQGGFSLIELAIGMAVVGLLISGGVSLYQSYRAEKKNADDRVAYERIGTAMATFLQQNGHYPCPAAPTLSRSNPNFGRAVTPCTATTVAQGALPVVDLGLPLSLAGDVYSNKLTYAVSSGRTNAATYNNAADAIIVQGRTRDASNALVAAQRNLPFIIVSHGPDMKGAYAMSGSTITVPCGGSALDSENCNGDERFRNEPYASMPNMHNANHFDDSVLLSLVQRDTTLWAITPGSEGINIVNRNAGNVGIGVNNPSAKLNVRDGELRVESAGAMGKGNINTRGDIAVTNSANASAEYINADRNIIADEAAKAGTVIRARRFCYNIDIDACD